MVKQATKAPATRRRAELEEPPVPAALIQDTVLKDKVIERAHRIAESEGFVMANIPKGGIEVTMDGHVPFKFSEGIQKVPRVVAEHWFARARGVEIIKPV